jgi:hypothetical protein
MSARPRPRPHRALILDVLRVPRRLPCVPSLRASTASWALLPSDSRRRLHPRLGRSTALRLPSQASPHLCRACLHGSVAARAAAFQAPARRQARERGRAGVPAMSDSAPLRGRYSTRGLVRTPRGRMADGGVTPGLASFGCGGSLREAAGRSKQAHAAKPWSHVGCCHPFSALRRCSRPAYHHGRARGWYDCSHAPPAPLASRGACQPPPSAGDAMQPPASRLSYTPKDAPPPRTWCAAKGISNAVLCRPRPRVARPRRKEHFRTPGHRVQRATSLASLIQVHMTMSGKGLLLTENLRSQGGCAACHSRKCTAIPGLASPVEMRD